MKEKQFEQLIVSRTMAEFFYGLDDKCKSMEDYIKQLEQERDEWRDKYNAEMHNRFKESQKMMGETLKAALLGADIGPAPSMESLGTVGATMIATIRDFTTIKQVHEYINKFVEANKEEISEV